MLLDFTGTDPQVRAAVARGLGHYADRSLAALLTYKLHSGDEDPVAHSANTTGSSSQFPVNAKYIPTINKVPNRIIPETEFYAVWILFVGGLSIIISAYQEIRYTAQFNYVLCELCWTSHDDW